MFKLESRSYKYSLSWKATKEVAPGEHTAAMAGWEDLEQEANGGRREKGARDTCAVGQRRRVCPQDFVEERQGEEAKLL